MSELEGLDGIAGAATRSNGRQTGTLAPTVYELQVTEPKAAVTSLLTWSEARGVDVRGLEVVPGTLEDVFLQLTGRELRD
jgi:hypothetical protein